MGSWTKWNWAPQVCKGPSSESTKFMTGELGLRALGFYKHKIIEEPWYKSKNARHQSKNMFLLNIFLVFNFYNIFWSYSSPSTLPRSSLTSYPPNFIFFLFFLSLFKNKNKKNSNKKQSKTWTSNRLSKKKKRNGN